MPQTVAFVGLGAMGLGMARCLVRKGFTVRGYDIRSEPLDRLSAEGGMACRSPAEAGTGAQGVGVIVLVAVPADEAEQAGFGEHGLVETPAPKPVVVCRATRSPPRTRALAARATE